MTYALLSAALALPVLAWAVTRTPAWRRRQLDAFAAGRGDQQTAVRAFLSGAPRPGPADASAVEYLVERCAAAGHLLPSEYLQLLRYQDGFKAHGLVLHGTGHGPMPALMSTAGPDGHLVLAEDAGRAYTQHSPTGAFHVLDRGTGETLSEHSDFPRLLAVALDANRPR